MMNWLFGAMGMIIAGGLVAEFLPGRMKAGALTIGIGLAAIPLVWLALAVLISGQVLEIQLDFLGVLGEVAFRVDPLAAFFVLLIVFGSFAASLFSVGYVSHYLHEGKAFSFHFFFLALLVTSMILLCVVQNALAFLIVWELMSLSSFMLVVFDHETPEVLAAGINYLIAMHIGVVFLIGGYAWLTVASQGLDFAGFQAVLDTDPVLKDLLFGLFLVGYGTKAGLVPFHTWLPKAHPAAPGHVSALMSGVMIKTGLYGLMRFLTWCGRPSLTMAILLLSLSAISALVGIGYALHERDLKRLLAWSSIENIGLIGFSLGLVCLGLVFDSPGMANLAAIAACLHIINHALFKMLLFFGAGQVASLAQTRNLEALGGLSRFLPGTALFFLIGSLAICALPPFNGFISELLMYFSLLEGVNGVTVNLHVSAMAGVALLALIGAMAIIAFSRAFSVVFSGQPRSKLPLASMRDSPVTLVAMTLLAIPILLIGIYPTGPISLIGSLANQLVPGNHGLPISVLSTMTTLSLVGFGLLLGVMLLAGLRWVLVRRRSAGLTRFRTWDCGYQGNSPRIQYTASSYSDLVVTLARPLIKVKRQMDCPQGEFPAAASLSTTNSDRVEDYLIRPLIGGLMRFLGFFSVLQSKNVKQYLIYAISFIIIIVCVVVGVPK